MSGRTRTISIPPVTNDEMYMYPDENWSHVACEAFKKRLFELKNGIPPPEKGPFVIKAAIKAEMDQYPEVNWAMIAQEAIELHLARLFMNEKRKLRNESATRPPRQPNTDNRPKLVTIKHLIQILFPDPESRPSLRSIQRLQKARKIPVTKVGRLCFYEPDRVGAALRRLEVPVSG